MKVSQFKNDKGIAVKNQFLIEEVGRGANGNFLRRITFQSYDSVIAVKTFWNDCVDVVLDKAYWDYSKTTGKYRNQFLGEDKKKTEGRIESGIYKLEDLNKGE